MSDLEVKMQEVGEWWNSKMPMMAMEECAELVQAISKFERNDLFEPEIKNVYGNLVKEIADVYISIHALIHWYGEEYGDLLEIPNYEEQMKEDIMSAIEAKLNKKY